jgi:hypothetical protein
MAKPWLFVLPKKKKKSAIKKKSPLNVNVKNIVVVILSFSFF